MTATLLAMRASALTPKAPLWPTGIGTHWSSHNLRNRVLKPTATDAGMPWIGFHTFRHTCASLLFEGGKSSKQVQEWLGHSDPAFTMRVYVHLIDEGLGSADFLDDVLPSGASPTPATKSGGQSASFSPNGFTQL